MAKKPIRVLIDGLVFENQHQFGIWRIFNEVIRRAAQSAEFTLWLRSNAVQPVPPGIQILRDYGRTPVGRWNLCGRLRRRGSNLTNARRQVRPADVYHSTYFTPCPLDGPAVVVTVYDMIAESMYPYAGGWPSNADEKRIAIQSASLIITISRATADDLTRFFPEVAPRIRVAHLGADHLMPRSTER